MSNSKNATHRRFNIPNPQIKDAADQYSKAAVPLLSQSPGSGVLLPFLTTAAFSIELYLKSLNAEDVHHAIGRGIYGDIDVVTAQSVKNGHPLIDLFVSLDEKIIDTMKDASQRSELSTLYPALENVLKKYSSLFVGSRYSFEKLNALDDTKPTHLAMLVKFTRDFVHGLPRRCSSTLC